MESSLEQQQASVPQETQVEVPSGVQNSEVPAHTQPEPSIENNKTNQDIPQPFNQVDLAAMKNKIQRLLKMDNLADITLAGYMIKLLRQKSKLSFRDLHEEVSKCYDVLRRSDGSKYTGDVAKALKGCLTSSEIFKEAGDNVWGIREKEAKMYEDKTTKKLKTLINKKKGRGKKKESELEDDGESDDDFSGSEDGSDDSLEMEKSMPAKKVKTTTGSYGNTCNMLELYISEVKADVNMGNSISQNSIEILNRSASKDDVLKTMNKDRFLGMLECFEYFSPMIKEYLKNNQGVKPENFAKKGGRGAGKVKIEATSTQENGNRPTKGKK